MRRTPLVLAGFAVLALSGCGTGAQPLASSADRDVRQRAENAGFAMAKTSRGASAFEHARRVVGGTAGDTQIVLLEAEGTGMDGHVVLQITSVYDDDSPLDNDSVSTACFKYTFSDSSHGTVPDEVGCDGRTALPLPPPPFEPVLPADTADRLTALLNGPAPASRAQAAFPEEGLEVRSAEVEGAIGVAVGAGPGECVMGQRLPNGQVQVWHVPRIFAMPGELGCDPAAAADGLGQTSPH